MKGFVSYLSKPNYEARDAQDRFEGTFRWPWLASLWATLHPSRPMHLFPVVAPGVVITSHAPAVAARPVAVEPEQPAPAVAARTSSARRSSRRRPAARQAA
jgi:hypothetical protein